MNRREFIASISAATVAGWEADGDPPRPEEWDPVSPGVYHVLNVNTEKTILSCETNHWGILLEEADFDESVIQVAYTDEQVTIDIDAEGRDHIHADMFAALDPDAARDLAVAIYSAAEEMDRREFEELP